MKMQQDSNVVYAEESITTTNNNTDDYFYTNYQVNSLGFSFASNASFNSASKVLDSNDTPLR